MKIVSLYLYVLFAFIILTACSTIPEISREDIVDRDNLLLNYSFELGMYDKDLMPLGWFTLTDEPGIIKWDQIFARTGSKSLKVSPEDSTVEIISESFPISPKNIYLINSYVRSLKSKQTSIKLAFMAFDKKGSKVNYYYKMFYPDSSWTEISFRTGFLNDHARYARVIIILPEKAGTDFWIDDVECFMAHNFAK